MHVRIRLNPIAIWLVAGAIAALSCSLTLTAAHFGNEYIPVGNDSFYHARRILDAVRDPGGFYQFDPRIGAPEGSLLVWPWGYDYLMSILVRGGLAVGLSSDPMAILAWIPVGAVFASIGLLVLCARQLGLSLYLTSVAALCMALAVTTQLLHGVGAIDHHYAEMIALLGSLCAGLSWLKQPQSGRCAVVLGLTLGLAPAIHNALFILQIPLLATLLVQWLLDRPPPPRASMLLGGVLVVTTLAIALPSLPFRQGRFEFYTLSWFQVYVATCSAVTVVLLSLLRPTRRGSLVLLTALAAMLVALLGQLGSAHTFLAGLNRHLDQIGEMQSPVRAALTFGTPFITRVYSYAIYAAPLTAVLCAVQCWRDRSSVRLLFWITSLSGLCLLSLQLRMHYFGDFALYLPWLVVCHDLANIRPELRKRIQLAATLVLVLAYAPVLRYQIAAPIPHANDLTFDAMRPVYATLRAACAKDPGIVLADNNAGHFIRYYTECSVIADNFLLTQQQFEKTDQVQHWFSVSAAQLLAEAPQVKYLLVRPSEVHPTNNGVAYTPYYAGAHALLNDLFGRAASAALPGYELLHEVTLAEPQDAPYARLYRLSHASGATSSNSSLSTTSGSR
jgi:hypothetical protein